MKKRANELGIFDVHIHCNDLIKLHNYLKNKNIDDICLNNLIDRSIWDQYALKGSSLLFLISEIPGLMDDIEVKKIQKMVDIKLKTIPYYKDNVTKYIFPWCIAALPNEMWAKSVFGDKENAYQKLWFYILKMCMIDTPNPIESWEKYILENNIYKRKLNDLNITKMHYTNSLGTNLYVEKPFNNEWINLDKSDMDIEMIANMPSYEVFTVPDKCKTEGIVYSSKPLFVNGNCIDDFFLEFEAGKVVNCQALKGQKALEEIIKKDDGSCYLGEIALVDFDSPISNTEIVFKSTLFDENASCHFALGRAFSKCVPNFDLLSNKELNMIGYNNSKIHTDFMIGTDDLNIEADTKDGKKLIFKNGNFNI